MSDPPSVRYEVTGRVARLTLNRPERGNGITLELVRELGDCVERADLDPAVHVLLLAGEGPGFCAGYDLVESAERLGEAAHGEAAQGGAGAGAGSPAGGSPPPGSPLDPEVIAAGAKIGYPPARVWGSPTTALWAHRIGAQRAKRLLFTGDSLSGAEAAEWGLAIDAPPDDRLDERAEALVERVAMMPVNQLRMMKLLVNQSVLGQGLQATQALGTLLDGIARHTAEGYAFQRRAAAASFKQAVRERDEPFGDAGRSTHKG